ncbi:MAG: beta-propeller fold lactonase family protein [Rhizobacter sp.]|nr:beta-propeller fold lactonase family protein [Ferruginibacter sp.]
MKKQLLKTAIGAAIVFSISSCQKNAGENISTGDSAVLSEKMMSENGANPDEASVATTGDADVLSRGNKHFIYTESNGSNGNRILKFEIKNNGSLEADGSVASGGNGTGAGLGSQGALVLDKNEDWLYAVNAGSNSVSSFKVNNNGSLSLQHTVASGGTTPVSVAVHGNLMYVLNRGSDNIQGFTVNNNGAMTAIAGSSKPLSSTMVDAPQISFTPDGDWVVVTEKATNKISTFKVKNNGSIQNGIFTNSVGATPFGFAFGRGNHMIVSNAVGGAAGQGSATSYITGNNGVPHAINGAKANYQSAPCWVAVTKYGRYAFITNTASNNVSSYYVAPWGALYLVDGNAANSGMGPLDIVVAENNFYVYTLNGGSHSISIYNRTLFGGLHSLGSESGLPAGTTGLATN